MKTSHGFRAASSAAGLMAGMLALSGCMGSPTYGTGTSAMEQLSNDLTSAVSIGPQDERNVKYNPRPNLVVAAEDKSLPPPQASLANRENNPGWVESPEETRARLRQEADENENNPRYRSPLLAGKGKAGQMTESEKWEAFRQAKQNLNNADVTQPRRSLTDPPVEYRAVDSAALDDLGEPELKKERRRKKEAEATQKTSSWWKPFQ
nr:lipoprotein [Rhizobium sp. Q54]